MKSKIILSILFVVVLLLGSCKNYLDEVNKTGKTEDLVYSTPDAIDGLVASCYSYNRLWYGKEAGFTMSEGGTDLWYNAAGNTAPDFVTYKNVTADPATDAANNNPCLDEYWEAFYDAINLCNTAEKYITSASFLTDAQKKNDLAQVYFLRAFYYWHLVETWGPVQLNLTPVTSPSTIATRNSVDEIYTQMFKDVQYGIDNLDNTAAPSSRITYWAAKAFRARLSLYYASEYGKTDYYAQAAQDAKDVINKCPGKSLYDNYSDCWLISNSSTTTNQEFIWAIDYYNVIGGASSNNFLPSRLKINPTTNLPYDWSAPIVRRTPANGNGSGNDMQLMLNPLWYSQTDTFHGASLSDVLPRYSGTQQMYTIASPSAKVAVNLGQFYVHYAVGYTRYAPTRYCLDLFDETKDQRYNGTFRTAWLKYPGIVPKNYGSPSCAYPNMTDTALYWSKRPLTASQKAWAKGRYKWYDVSWTFQADGVTPVTGSANNLADRMYAALSKWDNTDSNIPDQTSFNDYFSYRDFPIFRLSEMYLIAAEALMNTDQGQAVSLINALRAKRAIPGQDMSVSSVDIDLILAERAREFAGENIRWFDLKRTKKLETQILNNTKARPYFDPSKHYLRPIPSSQMNAVTNETSGAQSGGFWQNPGY
jgi:hypothetical protein